MPQEYRSDEVTGTQPHLNRPWGLVHLAIWCPLLADREPLRKPGRVPDQDGGTIGEKVKLPDQLPGSTDGIQDVRVLVGTVVGHQIWGDNGPFLEHVSMSLHRLDEVFREHQV